ncbi:MAG: RNA polymerase sigma factor [Ignavibacteriaceae bacterium]|nr:RNA polymerase sigma factor [Ignavibacteriaceae bacterium]
MKEEIPDHDLVRNFLNGDEPSFNKIINRYKHKIYWQARRMTGNHLDADEVVQEVLIVLYNKLKDFQFQSSLYTWIYRIVSTRSINFLRKRTLRKILSFDDQSEDLIISEPDIINDLEQREEMKKIDKLLQKLPVRQREIFILRNYEELSYEEISQITGKSVGGLKANYFHATNKMLELLKNEN